MFEYLVKDFYMYPNEDLQTQLDGLAADSWDLVGIAPQPSGMQFVFKRPVTE